MARGLRTLRVATRRVLRGLGILLTPALGPANAQLLWLLMAPMVVAERVLSGDAVPHGSR